MTEKTQQRVVLITGAARRVGRTVALSLADAGYDVAFTYLASEQPARELQSQIQAKSRRCLPIRADLTQPSAAFDAVFKNFSADFNRLDVLMNNASIYEPDATPSKFNRMSAIHVESPLALSRSFSPMLKAAGGCIINMLDLLAEHPRPDFLEYCASKAALWNLTLGLARHFAPDIRVNGIAPGVVEWPPDLPQSEREKYLRRVPLARAGQPQDVADAVLFLCRNAPYMTGQILRIDGGRSIA